MQRNWTSQALLVGMQNGTGTLENCLAISYKTSTNCTTQQLHTGTYSREMKTYVHVKTYVWDG